MNPSYMVARTRNRGATFSDTLTFHLPSEVTP